MKVSVLTISCTIVASVRAGLSAGENWLAVKSYLSSCWPGASLRYGLFHLLPTLIQSKKSFSFAQKTHSCFGLAA